MDQKIESPTRLPKSSDGVVGRFKLVGCALMLTAMYLTVMAASVFVLGLLRVSEASKGQFDVLLATTEKRTIEESSFALRTVSMDQELEDYRRLIRTWHLEEPDARTFMVSDAGTAEAPTASDAASSGSSFGTSIDYGGSARSSATNDKDVTEAVALRRRMADCVDRLLAPASSCAAGELVKNALTIKGAIAAAYVAHLAAADSYDQWIEWMVEQAPQLSPIMPLLSLPILPAVIRMPREIMVLLLAMLMGGLGGIINVSRRYADARFADPHIAECFYRPAVGAVIALAVYILFMAGNTVLLGSQATAAPAGTAQAFFIGFLGIVSGLNAREAIDWADRSARRVFGTATEQPPLVVRSLAGPLVSSGLSEADCQSIRQRVGVDETTWAAWLAGPTSIPRSTAQRIADYLRVPLDDLCSASTEAGAGH